MLEMLWEGAGGGSEPCQELADAQLHGHHHGIQAQHVILCLQGDAIG